MAITAVNASYKTAGPTVSGQQLAASGLSTLELAYVFSATATLDGSTTTFTVNYIDGTATLPFTPSAVLINVTGGTQQAATPVYASSGTPTTTGFPVYLSGAGTSANTVIVSGFILK